MGHTFEELSNRILAAAMDVHQTSCSLTTFPGFFVFSSFRAFVIVFWSGLQ